MSIFAPVYRPTKHQQTFLALQNKAHSKKRKREDDSSGDDDGLHTPTRSTPESSRTPRTASTAFHPVNKTDPYHVAGHLREKSLPPPPFPHAAVKISTQPKRPIDEELASLNPPLYAPTAQREDKSTSLKRRHADNLTTILHKCMLKGDWQRASHAWSLLIRTEIAGRAVDVRRNGRWAIGAELLMRRDVAYNAVALDGSMGNDDGSRAAEYDVEVDDTEHSPFSDAGFQLARNYYERLILQYPHTTRTQHTFNDTVVYPALFNVWIHEVQDRSKRAREKAKLPALSAAEDAGSSIRSFGTDHSLNVRQIRNQELEQASLIAQRMDYLLLSPPYDSSTALLQLRGMVALWLSDLYEGLAGLLSERASGSEDDDEMPVNRSRARREAARHRTQSEAERKKARKLFAKVKAAGADIPYEAQAAIEDDTD